MCILVSTLIRECMNGLLNFSNIQITQLLITIVQRSVQSEYFIHTNPIQKLPKNLSDILNEHKTFTTSLLTKYIHLTCLESSASVALQRYTNVVIVLSPI